MECWENAVGTNTSVLHYHDQQSSFVVCWRFAHCAWLVRRRSGIENIPRVGVLVAGQPPTRPSLEGFRQGLRDLGYVEGKNIQLELRWDEGNPDRWAELADEPRALEGGRDFGRTRNSGAWREASDHQDSNCHRGGRRRSRRRRTGDQLGAAGWKHYWAGVLRI